MPSDPGEGLAFALSYLAGLVALVFFLAWLEGPSRRRQQLSAWWKGRFATGASPLAPGRHRAPTAFSSLRGATTAATPRATAAPTPAAAGGPPSPLT